MNPSAAADPLAQLRDIHLPTPISWWPPAPGWYILAALVLMIMGLFAWHSYRRLQQYRFQQTVLAELDGYLQQPSPAWDAVNLLIKRVAFIHHSRPVIAGLTGEAWLAWLDKQTDAQHSDNPSLSTPEPYRNGPGRILLMGPYQQYAPASKDIHDLLRLTMTHLLTTKGRTC